MKQNKLRFEAARRRVREDRTTSESKKDASKRIQEFNDETTKIEKDIETAEKLGSFFAQSLDMDAELEQLRKDLHESTHKVDQRESELNQLFDACVSRLQKGNPDAVARLMKIASSVV
ncbi:hypothetical protein AAVH_07790 [Aphelenchoides avenae]|nr:hypothetical protein AAVH_07790 [Aphelenchus avenae]